MCYTHPYAKCETRNIVTQNNVADLEGRREVIEDIEAVQKINSILRRLSTLGGGLIDLVGGKIKAGGFFSD
jgi:hypothetical protein